MGRRRKGANVLNRNRSTSSSSCVTAARRASRSAARNAAPSTGNGIGKTGNKRKGKSKPENKNKLPQFVGSARFHIPKHYSKEEHDRIYFTAKKLALRDRIPLQEAINKVIENPRHYHDWAKRQAVAAKPKAVKKPASLPPGIPNKQKIREKLGKALSRRTGLPLNIAIRKIKNSQIEQEITRLTAVAKRKSASKSIKKKPGKKKRAKSMKTKWIKVCQGGAPGLGGKN